MGKKILFTEAQLRNIIIESWGTRKPIHYSMDDRLEFGDDPNVVDGGNFPIKRNGKEYWVSRSMVISLYVFGYDVNGNLYILASKRGPGAKHGKGLWNVVAGFLDYGYSLEDTCVKECWEECGVRIDPNKVISCGIDSSRNGKRGDISAKFYTVLDDTIDKHEPSIKNCEPGEVTEAMWVPINKMKDLKWWGDQGLNAYTFANRLENKKKSMKNNPNFNITINGLKGLLKDNMIDEKEYIEIINILKR